MIGERLAELRKDAGLSQDQLAEILHINKHSVSSYERDKSEPPDEIKIRIARYFHVSADYLLGLSDNPVTESGRHLRLPTDFPPAAEAEAKRYIGYLYKVYSQK
ncbi:MAG: helix-turn-helix transcriptional regulator [Ruminococcaceae bacterium]|nr:helix-turn-helix transcriptional regulator [Oscillospiraceae bacterium]